MKRRYLFLMAALMAIASSAIELKVAQGYETTSVMFGTETSCNYHDNILNFDVLNNADGQYSDVWDYVLQAKRISQRINGGYGEPLDYPDIIIMNGRTYAIIAVADILFFADVSSVSLPYEVRYIQDNAFQTVCRVARVDSLNLPPAVAHIGLDAFKGFTKLRELGMQSPVPPACLTGQGAVTAGDDAPSADTPFPEFEDGCALSVPEGSLFFYRSHPCFSSAIFSGIIEKPVEEIWKTFSMIGFMSGAVKVAYIGNAEAVLLGIEKLPEHYKHPSLEFLSQDRVEGFRCSLVGIGKRAFFRYDGEKVNLPETLRFISDEAFRLSCLTEITIPESCRFAGYKAFADCKSLKTVTILTNETPVFAPDAFDGIPADATLVTYAPVDRTAAPWNAFAHIDDRSGVAQIPAEAAGTGTLYDLSGLPVGSPRPGTIYVRDGAKVIFR